MILNTTHTNKKNTELINDLVGKRYSFFQSLKMKGTGSKRMIVDEVSLNLVQYINKISDINYANIELRPKGIIFHINKGLQNYSWIIPYYKLVIFQSTTLSIHAEGMFIKLRNNHYVQKNNKFIAKILALKENFLNSIYGPQFNS